MILKYNHTFNIIWNRPLILFLHRMQRFLVQYFLWDLEPFHTMLLAFLSSLLVRKLT